MFYISKPRSRGSLAFVSFATSGLYLHDNKWITFHVLLDIALRA